MSAPGRERRTGLVLAGLGVAAGVAALGIGDAHTAGMWGARTVPLLAAAALVVAGLADALSGARSRDTGAPAHVPAPVDAPAAPRRRAWMLIAVAVLYALLLARIGYVASTALAALAAFALFGDRRPITLLAATLLCPLALHLVFFEGLGVFAPRARWLDAFDWLPT